MSKLLSRLLGGATGSGGISAALEKARAEAETADAAIAAAEAAYQAGLLDEPPAALRKLIDAKTDATIAADRARAVIAKLEAQLEKATADEAESRRVEQYENARQLTATARKKLAADYVKAANSIRGVLRAIAEADLAVQTANADLPAGAARLDGPEAGRGTPTIWREVVGEERVELWSGEGDTNPLSDDMQRRVQVYDTPISFRRRTEDGRAIDTGSVKTEGGGVLKVVKRTFLRREILPDVAGYSAPPLAATIELPALEAGASPLWSPARGDAVSVLQALDAPARPRPPAPAREPIFEYSWIRD